MRPLKREEARPQARVDVDGKHAFRAETGARDERDCRHKTLSAGAARVRCRHVETRNPPSALGSIDSLGRWVLVTSQGLV